MIFVHPASYLPPPCESTCFRLRRIRITGDVLIAQEPKGHKHNQNVRSDARHRSNSCRVKIET